MPRLDLTPSSDRVAYIANPTRTVVIAAVPSLEIITVFPGLLPSSLKLSNSGTMLAVGSSNGIMYVIDLANSLTIGEVRGLGSSGISAIMWSSDDSALYYTHPDVGLCTLRQYGGVFVLSDVNASKKPAAMSGGYITTDKSVINLSGDVIQTYTDTIVNLAVYNAAMIVQTTRGAFIYNSVTPRAHYVESYTNFTITNGISYFNGVPLRWTYNRIKDRTFFSSIQDAAALSDTSTLVLTADGVQVL